MSLSANDETRKMNNDIDPAFAERIRKRLYKEPIDDEATVDDAGTLGGSYFIKTNWIDDEGNEAFDEEEQA